MLVGALLGFAFLTKMMQAFTVVPAFGLAYMIAAPTSLRRRTGQLLASLVALVVAGDGAIIIGLIVLGIQRDGAGIIGDGLGAVAPVPFGDSAVVVGL